MRRLDVLGVPYDVTPGVLAYAAALERELTLPGVSQTVILTRTSTRSSPMPEGEKLADLARTGVKPFQLMTECVTCSTTIRRETGHVCRIHQRTARREA